MSENIYAPLVVEKTLFIILKLSVQILELAPRERENYNKVKELTKYWVL